MENLLEDIIWLVVKKRDAESEIWVLKSGQM